MTPTPSEAPSAPREQGRERRARWMRRAAAVAICLSALALRDTGSTRAPTVIPSGRPLGPTVRLVVESGSSSPIGRVRMTLSTRPRGSQDETLARHDGALPIAIDAPRDVPLVLQVEAAGRARYVARLVLDGDRTVRVPLPAGARLTGQAVDERGEPVSGAAVRITREASEDPPWLARTAADGSFNVDTLIEGATYRVEARARGHSTSARQGVEPGGEAVRLTLERVGLVAGRVVLPDGSGARGATIVIAGSGLWPARQAEANAEGRFRIADVPPGIYEVRAFSGDRVAEPRRGLEVEPGSPAYLTFSLTEGVTLRGIIRDSESGEPIEGAAISVSTEALDVAPRAATSSAEGRFTVRGLTNGPRRVSVFAEGYVPVAALEHEPGEPLEIELEPAATLAGVVLDEDRQPIVGATIEVVGETEERQPVALGAGAGFRAAVFASHLEPSLVPSSAALEVVPGPVAPIPLAPTELGLGLAPLPPSAEEVRTSASFLSDEEGRFRVSGIPPGHVQVIARRVGRAPQATERLFVAAGAVRDDIELVLPPAGELHGTIEDGRGDAVEGVLVEVRSDREPYPRMAFSDDRGEFTLDDVFGELTVTAMPQGRPAVRTSTTVRSSSSAEVALVLEGELHTLSGRAVDEAGYPVPQAQLAVVSLRADAPFRRTFFAAEDGTFTLSELPAPPWRVEASDPAFAPTRLDVTSAEEELRVILARGAALSGSVLDDFTDEPIAARVRLVREGLPPELREVSCGEDGTFHFARVPVGAWRLAIESERHLAFEREIEITIPRGQDEIALDAIRLAPAGWLEGSVVDALGVPMSRARVWLDEGPSARTDARGEFVLRGAPAGPVVVHASHPAAGEGASDAVRVLAGRETVGVLVRLPERFDAERAEALPGRRRGVALEVEASGGRIQVREVIAGTHAERAGLRAGDVLERIDGVEPESARRATALLRGATGVPAVIELRRGEERATVLVERETWLPP